MAKKTGRPPKFTPAQIIAALEASAGILLAAARILRCNPTTVRRYITAHREIELALREIIEDRLDIAEAGLVNFLSDDRYPALKLKAIEFYLLTKGKDRGYTKQTEVTGKGDTPIQTAVTLDRSGCTPEEMAILEQNALLAVKAIATH